jgi:predicted nuclease of predicted toxin-antitoxin system
MKLYLDEDIASHHLGQALRKAGHDVILPGEVGQMGKSDVVQFAYAVERDRILVTGNQRDFEDLHDLITLCGGTHPGILAMRKDNDIRRDMKPHHIVTAIDNIAKVIASIRNHVICLNDWR